MEAKEFIGKIVNVKMDRPLGSAMFYGINRFVR